ncbi:MAG: DUF2878 domain-containing protein [Thiotrichales bacterium]
MPRSRHLLLNFLLFQIGWLVCVLVGATSSHWAGPLFVAVVVAIHLNLATSIIQETKLIFATLAIGTAWDSLLVSTNLLQYQHGMLHPELAPHWIIAMWALFATTLNVSLRWLRGRWILAVIFGAVGGPLAYYAGYRLGAVAMPDMAFALLALAAGWAVIMPLLLWISAQFDGFSKAPDLPVEHA